MSIAITAIESFCVGEIFNSVKLAIKTSNTRADVKKLIGHARACSSELELEADRLIEYLKISNGCDYETQLAILNQIEKCFEVIDQIKNGTERKVFELQRRI